MIVVTGGAGFIGANIVKALIGREEGPILVVDDLGRAEKIRNLADLPVDDYMDKTEFREALRADALPAVPRVIFHQGACSDTMATDGRYVMDNNYAYSRDIHHYCRRNGVQFIYASSASVYGGGRSFREMPEDEHPLNAYAYSKFQFDHHVRRQASGANQVVGLRYFNVYGYREQHKHRMASVAWHFFNQYRESGKVRLFEGTDGFGPGEQRRDFVFVEDVVDVNLFFLDNPGVSGIFNVGTGHSGSFNEVACAVINTLREAEGLAEATLAELVAQGRIEYIPMPDALVGKYQSFTEAELSRLRDSGCTVSFHDVASGVRKYVRWLMDSD